MVAAVLLTLVQPRLQQARRPDVSGMSRSGWVGRASARQPGAAARGACDHVALLRTTVAAASSGWRRRPHRALPSIARSRVSEEVGLNRTHHGCDSTKLEGGSCE